jgi:hypothetical protein
MTKGRADCQDAVGDLFDYLTGSPVENAQHILARRAFLRVFLTDDRVDDLFRRWEEESALFCLEDDLKQAIKFEAVRYWDEVLNPDGKADIDLWRLPPSAIESLPAPSTVRDRCGGPIERALQKVSDDRNPAGRYPEPLWPDFVAETKGFVAGLGLPYPWLVVAVLGEFGRRFLLPDFEIPTHPSWYDGSGYLPGAWLRRRDRGWPEPAGDADTTLVPERAREALPKWAEWFYRSRVRGESIRSIARAAFGTEVDRRKDVKDGIARVEALFELTAHGVPG